jgi:hypothetical protein
LGITKVAVVSIQGLRRHQSDSEIGLFLLRNTQLAKPKVLFPFRSVSEVNILCSFVIVASKLYRSARQNVAIIII